MSLGGDARQAGVAAVGALRATLAERLAALLRRQPDLVGPAIEVGLVEKNFLDDPTGHPLRTATAAQVMQRFLERTAERRPSVLASLGLNALEALTQLADRDIDEPAGTPLAVMFTDLEGFTRFTSRQGDEEASGLLVDHHRAVGPIVRSRGGRVVKRLGDGLLVTFPVPDAAVHAAIELLDTAPEPLRLRAGLNWGDVVLTRDDVIGHVVNIAARVTELAKGGEVLVTEAVVAETGDLPSLEFGRLRRRGLKGIDQPVRVCRVTPVMD